MSAPLTAGEHVVLRRIAAGDTTGEIGRALHLAEDTIKSRVRMIFRKLGARDRANAVHLAYQLGILTAPAAVTATVAPRGPWAVLTPGQLVDDPRRAIHAALRRTDQAAYAGRDERHTAYAVTPLTDRSDHAH